MSPRATSLNTVAPDRCNNKSTSTRLVSVETAFDRALRSGGLHVSDGSLYEASEPAIDLIEEVTARELPFPAPDATTHVRVTYSGGPDRFVSFSPRTFTEQDDYREFLCVELGRVYLNGVEVEPGNLADDLDEALEEWVLVDWRAA
jgi:hypothetical protein